MNINLHFVFYSNFLKLIIQLIDVDSRENGNTIFSLLIISINEVLFRHAQYLVVTKIHPFFNENLITMHYSICILIVLFFDIQFHIN